MSIEQAKRLVTAEELWEMPEVPGKRYELVKGELIEVPGAGALHNLIAALVYRLIYAHTRDKRLGVVFTDGVGYILGRRPDHIRIPDVSFVSVERIPNGDVPEGYLPLAPDLAVEVVSPNDRAHDVYAKVREYLDAGVRLVWVLWPRHRSVTVYSSTGEMRDLREGDVLDGGDVLPGFQVRVAELFEVSRGR